MPEFTVEGSEVVRKTVSETGTGAHVFVPKEWRGEDVMVVRLEEPTDTEGDRDAPPEFSTVDYDPVFDSSASMTESGREIGIEEVDSSNVWAGKYPRQLFESAATVDDGEVKIGYSSDSQRGFRPVSIGRTVVFRHTALFGDSGHGKTTLLKNLMVQWAYAGDGFCYIDSGGGGSEDLLRKLPAHRLDDVVWVDPSDASADRVVGFNFLEPTARRGNPRSADAEVETIVDGARDLLVDDPPWGERMDALFWAVCRSMVESDRPYTLVDLHRVFADDEYRHRFAEEGEPKVRESIVALGDQVDAENVEPLLRRLTSLTESRAAREVIAHGDATLGVRDAVENGAIVLVKNGGADTDERRLIVNAIARQIHGAIRGRIAMPEGKRTPYHVVIDGLVDAAGDGGTIERMLSKGRSMRVSFTLCCQQPSQLPAETRKTVLGKCDTLLAMKASNIHDSETIMKRFGERDAADLMNLGRYEMVTSIGVGPRQSDAFVTSLFPPYPPLRTPEEADAVKEDSLHRYGTARLDVDGLSDEALLVPPYD